MERGKGTMRFIRDLIKILSDNSTASSTYRRHSSAPGRTRRRRRTGEESKLSVTTTSLWATFVVLKGDTRTHGELLGGFVVTAE